MADDPVLSWLHIGDMHITEPGLETHQGLERITALAAGLPPGSLDFALLPGDNDALGAPPLPYADTVGGYRCLVLDVVAAGTGGPDTQLGPDRNRRKW